MSKTRSSSLVVSSLETLGRLLSCGEKDTEQWHSVLTRIQQLISNKDQCRRDLLLKKYGGVELLLATLQVSSDGVLMLDIIQVFDEVAKNVKGCLVLARRGVVPVVMRSLTWVVKRSPHDKQLINSIHVLLVKLASKEKQFGLKARLSGILPIPLAVVQQSTVSTVPRSTLLPALQLLRLVATKGVNTTFLGREGAVNALMKVIRASVSSDLKVLKAALEALAAVSLNKTNAVKVCGNSGVKFLVTMVSQWHRNDKDNRHIAIRRSLLTILKHTTTSEVGQKAFLACDGMKALFEIVHVPESAKEVRRLITLALLILRSCCPRQPLPLASPHHCVTFEMPGHPSTNSLTMVTSSTETEEIPSELLNEEAMNGEINGQHLDETSYAEEYEITTEVKGDNSQEERISNFSSRSSSGIALNEEAGQCVQKWEEPIDLSFFDCYFAELHVEQSMRECHTSSCQLDIANSTLQIDIRCTCTTEPQPSYTSLSKSESEHLHQQAVPVREGWFSKMASPETYGHVTPSTLEPLHQLSQKNKRELMFEDIERIVVSDTLLNRVVFNLDALEGKLTDDTVSVESRLDNVLKFESRFESGNLRKAIQVRTYEYDLLLNPDIGSDHHHQWFYFEVSNMESGVMYRFNIVNCEKPNSQFNFGMQPLVYSTKLALCGSPSWTRSGERISYYRNHFTRLKRDDDQKTSSTGRCYTLTFTLTFPFDDDICYVAYHYPYTYTSLQAHLAGLRSLAARHVWFSHQTLCTTLAGNPCDLLTITGDPPNINSEPDTEKEYIFLTARVHPGETNASWIMKGVLEFLLSTDPAAAELRQQFVFKIVPMLNPDGVINGSHRCSLSGQDLNRCWINPDPLIQPTIYHTKALIQYLVARDKAPLVFCDFHGHSRKKGIFIYGCGNTDCDKGEQILPRILGQTAPLFEYNSCKFVVEKSKEATARVVVWRQMGVQRSYTMESTYCGAETGIYKGVHISTEQLETMGKVFCQCLLFLHCQSSSTEESSVCGEPLATQPDVQQEDSYDSNNESVLTESDQLNESTTIKQDEYYTDTSQ